MNNEVEDYLNGAAVREEIMTSVDQKRYGMKEELLIIINNAILNDVHLPSIGIKKSRYTRNRRGTLKLTIIASVTNFIELKIVLFLVVAMIIE